MRITFPHDERRGAFFAKSAYLRSAALIEGPSGSRRQTYVSVLMTLMRWGLFGFRNPNSLFPIQNSQLKIAGGAPPHESYQDAHAGLAT